VKRDSDYNPFRGIHIKRETVSLLEVELSHWNPDYFSLDVIEVADLKAASPEVLIPADPVQKLMYRYHDFCTLAGMSSRRLIASTWELPLDLGRRKLEVGHDWR